MATQDLNDLTVLSTNKFNGFPDGNILSWCPKMDLLAVSMNKTSIWVFRLNGERVYSINNRSQIVHLGWNSSGKFFVVSGTDNFVKVYDSNTGNLVNKFATSMGLPITLTSWCSMDVERYMAELESHSPYQDFFKVDVLKHMPKLSNEVDSFFTESGIVSLNSTAQLSVSVTSTNENEALLDYLLVVNSNALMTITFNNLFTVSDVELPENCTYLKHTMTKDLFTQYFLVEDDETQLHLLQLHLSVSGGTTRRRLIEIIRWCSQIVSILNHISDQLNHIVTEAKDFLVVFDRHFCNLKDSLDDSGAEDGSIIDTLTDILLTGLIPTLLKDYWLNQFGERGLTRVSSVGNSAYDSARKSLFTQIILALEKLIILLSNLEGIAKTAKNAQQETFGMEIDSIENSIRSSQDLLTKFYGFIWSVNEEQELFNKFLNWCKVEVVEKLSKEEQDAESFFTTHPTMSFKVSEVLQYLNCHMLNPVFMRYLRVDATGNGVLLQTPEDDLDLHTSIDSLQHELNNTLLKGIQEYISREVKFTQATQIPVSPGQAMCNLKIFSGDLFVTSVQNSCLSIVRFDEHATTKLEIQFPATIIAHELIDETKLLVLHLLDDQSSRLDLLSVSTTSSTVQFGELQSLKSVSFNQTTHIKQPTLMAINGTDDPIIGCVLDASKQHYMVFRL